MSDTVDLRSHSMTNLLHITSLSCTVHFHESDIPYVNRCVYMPPACAGRSTFMVGLAGTSALRVCGGAAGVQTCTLTVHLMISLIIDRKV